MDRESYLSVPSFSCDSETESASGFQPIVTRRTAETLKEMTEAGEAISVLVVSDAEGARLAARARIDIVVVGFSDGPPPGIPSESSATLAQTEFLLKQVRHCNDYSWVIADIPLESYRQNLDLVKVGKRLRNAGADAVKVEGGQIVARTVRELTNEGVGVIGHIGYTPKTGVLMRRRGVSREDLLELERDAESLVVAGACGLVLELVEPQAATYLTQIMPVPTIGIFSGGGTSGQVLVLNDILELTDFSSHLFPNGKPRGVGRWNGTVEERLFQFRDDVKSRTFPLLHCLKSESGAVEEDWLPSGSHFRH